MLEYYQKAEGRVRVLYRLHKDVRQSAAQRTSLRTCHLIALTLFYLCLIIVSFQINNDKHRSNSANRKARYIRCLKGRA